MTTQKAIERSASNTLNTLPAQQQGAQPVARSRWYYRPHADIFEAGDQYTIVLDMPGVSPENLEITFENGALAVHGRVVAPEQQGERRALRTEYGIGDYFRRFELDNTIDSERISAECASGVVNIHLPKVEAARPVRIPVSG